MKGLKDLSHVFLFSKISLIIFTALIFLILSTGCEMLVPEPSGAKIDVADASETKSIGPLQDQSTTTLAEESDATEEIVEEETLVERKMEIKAYYCDEMAEYVIGETRIIIGTTKEDFILASFQEIIKDPSAEDLYNIMPVGTQIIGAHYADGTATINLSREFVDNKGSELVDTLVLACIVNTLTEIEGIEGVSFEIEGEKLSLYGSHDLSIPIRRNYSLIKGT
jgi:spore germination protein GerM